MSRVRSFLFVVVAALAAIVPASASAGIKSGDDIARYILPPGNYGGLPLTARVVVDAVRQAHAGVPA